VINLNSHEVLVPTLVYKPDVPPATSVSIKRQFLAYPPVVSVGTSVPVAKRISSLLN
jgi:hypothetical protein